MPDAWDTDDGQTHYVGDGCDPPHEPEWISVLPDELDALRDAVAGELSRQLVNDPGHPKFEVLIRLGNKLGMNL